MRFFVSLFMLISFFSYGQVKTRKGEKDNKTSISDYSKSWLIGQNTQNDTAKIYYYPNGTIKAKGNRINGEWNEFFESGKIKIKQTFINGKLSGETYCYSENGNILLPRFITQAMVKNDTSISNNSSLNLYRLFDSRDSTNKILNLEAYLSDSIKICDNGNLTIRIGVVQFVVKLSVVAVHVNVDAPCKENITTQRFSTNQIKEKAEKEYFKTQLGKIEVEHKQLLCANTGHNPIKITSNDKSIYLKDIDNLIFFEYDIDKGGNKELFVLNYNLCEKNLEIYKIDE